MPTIANAQIVPDGTLPNNSIVRPKGELQQITGGTQAGGNLFHSFDRFNVRMGETAWFDNALSVENVITRITGGQISSIDGLIRVNSTANLILVNPNGIVFGENARLDIGGSFLGSTADSLVFEDGSIFSAKVEDRPPLLTISVPIGLQLGSQPGTIQVRGTGNLQFFDREITFATGGISGEGLTVPPGRTLALVGGNLELVGGTLRSIGGRVELASFGDGIARLNPTPNGWTIDPGTTRDLRDISLSAASGLDTGGPAGGAMQLQGRNILLDNGSILFARALSEGSSGAVAISASESVELQGSNPFDANESIVIVGTLGAGNGSDVTITAARLRLQEGALISAPSFGTGNAGNITVNAAEAVELIGNSPTTRRASSLLASTFSSGKGGNVTVNTGRLSIRDGATVQSATFGTGPAGEVTVNATRSIEVVGTDPEGTPSRILADTSISDNLSEDLLNDPSVNRDSGNLFLSTPFLRIAEGGDVTVANDGPGNAGNIRVEAGRILLEHEGKLAASTASGIGGNVDLQAESVVLRGGSEIAAESGGTGNGGNLTLATSTLALLENSRITANAFKGLGGNIQINTQGIFIAPNSVITASSQLGVDGIVEINNPAVDPASGLIELTSEVTDPTDRIVSSCGAAEDNSFVITGRGGLAATPTEILQHETVWEDLRNLIEFPEEEAESVSSFAPSSIEPRRELVEATGWRVREDGVVELVARGDRSRYLEAKIPPCGTF
ncbi:MAG TPA: filamentous hemagglutinin N-terminal domain-containing protein [Oscillatoriales cyanobacterium M59_W2019_021]|nr:filamentous hemagglutinin N-terminal domain-containing protein [Oscillatoriales cyanobacterium M4454_W2019_049]HIK51411.1 filamentous hemagglutinin N-terminal domain-containing protein [Oscillatoriales cyanobacterium M59_W2019_021]